MDPMQLYENVHTVSGSNGNGNILIHIYVVIAIKKWVYKPFNNDAVAVAVTHSVNTLIYLHWIHSWKKILIFRCRHSVWTSLKTLHKIQHQTESKPDK